MKIHIIVDFMYLYYKYKYTIESNRIRRLITDVEWIMDDESKKIVKTDVSYIYYPLKEIEGFRRQFEKEGHEVTLSVCFDAVSMRKVENVDYKSNRTKRLGDDDFEQIDIIRKVLDKAGYNVYWVTSTYGLYSDKSKESIDTFIMSKEVYNALDSIGILGNIKNKEIITVDTTDDAFNMKDNHPEASSGVICNTKYQSKYELIESINTLYGYEADDVIANLLKQYKNNFDFSVVYTPDADLLINVENSIGINRYKAGKGYTAVGVNNFSAYCSAEFKCNIPYNGLMLYKCCVGDKSDVIKGIGNFGGKAFDRLVDYLSQKGIDWTTLGEYENTLAVLDMCKDILTDIQIEQAKECLSLVKPIIIEEGLTEPSRVSTQETRNSAYSKLNMVSLIE